MQVKGALSSKRRLYVGGLFRAYSHLLFLILYCIVIFLVSLQSKIYLKLYIYVLVAVCLLYIHNDMRKGNDLGIFTI